MSGLLNGVRVVELASWTYVPCAGAALADWGADVVKVEDTQGGDPCRYLVVGGLDPAQSPVRANFMMELGNHGKRSIGVDIKSERGREIIGKLIANADVFLTNWLPAPLERAGLTVERIREFNPNVIIARGSGHGSRGPERDRGGFDAASYLARAGVAYALTPPDVEFPVTQTPAFGDLQGGITLAGGIATALFHRERTGHAALVDSSLLAQGMWAVAPDIAAADYYGIDRIPAGSAGTALNPAVNRYKTRDGRWVQLMLLQTDRFWQGFCERIGRGDLATDERFVPLANLVANAEAATAELRRTFAERDLAEWQKVLADEPAVWSTLASPQEVLADPQVAANGYLMSLTDDRGKTYRTVSAPVQFDETPAAPSRAPEHGEHTETILLELGLEWDDIVAAKDAGAVL
ncbi:CaiB/BaiF CoA transferase family protein [Nocardia wallacei]|uniref:CaiB/BaiF CoA transferase family protein n=1 Tax=Nocardia wallacei TaxID=480035 RepID=UPI0024558B85|nr:CoA transferase [Nocardia wallacei]